ncbi:hypothetical protein OO013_15660 [Mangrovivirga sp. M17]|uniref:Lipoprotein n=1 Tax=Mangrovivirga halotolerans TaxID=2993936 RepID=A0ABT3RVC1_9BACT|nr:hypothetical protein [Mangrovivirga halotolerans]MCX2745314.1 hypothetical protein [Mangrovivirga halotolerans]
MKRFVFVIILVVFFSSCCDTNQECCGDPPDPQLTPEAKSWLSIYQGKDYFVYENTSNQKDTLWVAFETDVESCGGDECVNGCEIERALLKTSEDSTLAFSIDARLNDLIAINESRFSGNDSTLIAASLYLQNDYVSSSPDFTNVELVTDYLFQNEKVTILKVTCKNDERCEGFRMQSMIVSKEIGLIEFTDTEGEKWIIVK